MQQSKKSDYSHRHAMLHDYRKEDIRQDASRFLRVHMFTERLRKYIKVLTMQEYRDLRQQALDGDINGAAMKLENILSNKACRSDKL